MRSCRLLTWRRRSLLLRGSCWGMPPALYPGGGRCIFLLPFHHFQIVAARLVSVASASCMDQDEDLAFSVDAQAFSRVLVEYLVGTFDLDEVVSAPEASQLWCSSRPCVVGYFRRVRGLHAALFLDGPRILRPGVSFVDGPVETVCNSLVKLHRGEPDLAPAA